MNGVIISISRFILNLCSVIFAGIIIFSIIDIFRALYYKIRGQDTFKGHFTYYSSFVYCVRYIYNKSKTWMKIIFACLIVVGIANIILMHNMTKAEIGAFYEYDEYIQYYEATLETPANIPCIVMIQAGSDFVEQDTKVYEILSIKLPYGKEFPVVDYVVINTDDMSFDMYLGDIDIVAGTLGDVADAESYDFLDNYKLCEYGIYCASRKSDVLHYSYCYYVDNIHPKNRVYFNDYIEGELLGYKYCNVCKPG